MAVEALVAVFPPDGSALLYGDVPIEVVLGANAVSQVPTITASVDGVAQDTPCDLTESGTIADCQTLHVTSVEQAVSVSVSVLGQSAISDNVPGWIPDGPGWDLFQGVTVTAFGGTQEAASLADTYLIDGGAWATLVGYDGTPGDWQFQGGSAYVSDSGPMVVERPGMTFIVSTTVDADGHVSGRADTAWLPARANGQVLHLLVLDVVLEADLQSDGVMVGLRLSGDLPAVTLEEASAPLGAMGPAMLDLVELDVDRDGDGQPDAAHILLEGDPASALLTSAR
ncbi:MAG: hypothetical protein KC621_03315 [Myxococcales bacterium]|nr:hypothetical protein [Myxococcales bacterium]